MIKICPNCKKEKDFSNFTKDKNRKDGLCFYCKSCIRTQTKKRIKKIKKYRKIYYQNNSEKIKKRSNQQRKENKGNYDPEKRHNEYIRYKKKIKKTSRKYYKCNKNKILNNNKIYRLNNRSKLNKWRRKYVKEKRKNDVNFKLKDNLRKRIKQMLNLTNNKKTFRTFELVGCSIEKLREHLESLFKDNMTWLNYGSGSKNDPRIEYWVIDHIKPCASFDLSDPEEQKKCFHYTNLQPLWNNDNIKKSDKINGKSRKRKWKKK